MLELPLTGVGCECASHGRVTNDSAERVECERRLAVCRDIGVGPAEVSGPHHRRLELRSRHPSVSCRIALEIDGSVSYGRIRERRDVTDETFVHEAVTGLARADHHWKPLMRELVNRYAEARPVEDDHRVFHSRFWSVGDCSLGELVREEP